MPVRYDDARLQTQWHHHAVCLALNVLDGKVIGECHARHRHQEWLRFLRRLDGQFPPQIQLHLVMDNDTQRAARTSVAEEASTVCVPLHSDQFQLAELGGALFGE